MAAVASPNGGDKRYGRDGGGGGDGDNANAGRRDYVWELRGGVGRLARRQWRQEGHGFEHYPGWDLVRPAAVPRSCA